MQTAALLRPQEVTVMFRRIFSIAAVCGLLLALPALAGARPAQDPVVPSSTPAYHVSYGDTKYDLQNQQDLNGGAAADRVDRIGSLTPQQLAAAYGAREPKATTANVYVPPADPTKVYGVTKAPAAANTPAPASSDSDDGWQIAAISEAGLLALLACGSAALVVRARRRVTA
jgi:hypothetical protein